MNKQEENFVGKWSLGLMSGTSLDGIDAALIRTDGEHILEFGAYITVPYDEAQKAELREAVHGRGDILLLEQKLTLKHAQAVKTLLKTANLCAKDIAVIGFHGQTVSHRPAEHITQQIGDGALLAEKTCIDVVCDFRRRDMAAGGEGAPLVPLYHAALARHLELPIAILNIGGIANVSWIGRSEIAAHELLSLDILAFDTGLGNVLLNEWSLKHTGRDCDFDGALALAGTADLEIVAAMLKDKFFEKHPPKSIDRNAAIEMGAKLFPKPALQWFVAGGGRLNPAIMQALRTRFPHVYPVEALGWNGDALEAQAFAFLAVRSLLKLPLSLPTTTGAIRAVTGGALYRA